MDFLLGGDLGQQHDPTVFVLLGRTPLPIEAPTDRSGIDLSGDAPPVADAFLFAILCIEQMPLNSPYADIVTRLECYAGHPLLKDRLQIALDRTSVGRPVVELARASAILSDLIWGVTVTPGRKQSREPHAPMNFAVPKKDLVGHLQLALQRGRVKCNPRLELAGTLKKQLLSFSWEKKDNVTLFEGIGRTHDDYVTALCNAVWLSEIIPYNEDAEVASDANAPHVILPGLESMSRPAESWRSDLPSGVDRQEIWQSTRRESL